MDCEKVKNVLIEFADNTLNESDQKSVQNHLNHCTTCSESLYEFQTLFNVIKQNKVQQPDPSLEMRFNKMLETEKFIASKSETAIFDKRGRMFKLILQVAAALLLIFSGYQIGVFQNQELHLKEMAVLEKEKIQIKQFATFSLLENQSASKRLQAVTYAKEIQYPNNDILIALINKMNDDKHVNIRLAAANALSKFSSKELVKKSFIAALEVEKNISMQIELIQILVDIQEKRAIPTMKKLLHDKELPNYMKDQISTELKNII